MSARHRSIRNAVTSQRNVKACHSRPRLTGKRKCRIAQGKGKGRIAQGKRKGRIAQGKYDRSGVRADLPTAMDRPDLQTVGRIAATTARETAARSIQAGVATSIGAIMHARRVTSATTIAARVPVASIVRRAVVPQAQDEGVVVSRRTSF